MSYGLDIWKQPQKESCLTMCGWTEASRKASKKRGKLWENTFIFHSVEAGRPLKYYWGLRKQRLSWLLFHSLGPDASCMIRTVWSPPSTGGLRRRTNISFQRDRGYKTSDWYLSTAQKVISPMTSRVSHTYMYLQPTPKCLCHRELPSNFSFVVARKKKKTSRLVLSFSVCTSHLSTESHGIALTSNKDLGT